MMNLSFTNFFGFRPSNVATATPKRLSAYDLFRYCTKPATITMDLLRTVMTVLTWCEPKCHRPIKNFVVKQVDEDFLHDVDIKFAYIIDGINIYTNDEVLMTYAQSAINQLASPGSRYFFLLEYKEAAYFVFNNRVVKMVHTDKTTYPPKYIPLRDQYCCTEMCFEIRDRIDGIACESCSCLEYCRCECDTFLEVLKRQYTQNCTCPEYDDVINLTEYKLCNFPKCKRESVLCKNFHIPKSRMNTKLSQVERMACLQSYDNIDFPNVSPEMLADAGLRYTGHSDKVMCIVCGINLHEWQEGDNAHDDHAKYSPLCPLTLAYEAEREQEMECEFQMDTNELDEPTKHRTVQGEVVEVDTTVGTATPIRSQTLIENSDSSMSELAMDNVRVIPGTTTDRVVCDAKTPNGVKTAVQMTNGTPITLEKQTFLPSTRMSEWGNVWAVSPEKKVDDNRTYIVKYNDRTTSLMKYFQYYNSLNVWRVVAKAPLFSSKRFWVSYIPQGTKANKTNNIGFEWNPTEEPEIFVVTPWTQFTRVLPTETISGDSLQITDLTNTVFTEGLPTDLNMDVYCAPLEMYLYAPRVYKVPTAPTPPDFVAIPYLDGTYTSTVEWVPNFQRTVSTQAPANIIKCTSIKGQYNYGFLDNNFTGYWHEDLPIPPAKTWAFSISGPIQSEKMQVPIQEEYEFQINEYSYNENFSENRKDYGQTGNHTERIDKHWSLLNRMTWAAADETQLVNVETPVQTLAYEDRRRHLMFSKYPTIKLFCTSIPTANMQFRITQLPTDAQIPLSREDILQLPGVEFDPKFGPVEFTPYWNMKTPGDYVDSVSRFTQFAVTKMGGTMGVEPIEMTFLYNCKGVEYHHLSNVDGDDVEEEYDFQIDERDPIKTTVMEDIHGPDQTGEKATTSERRWNYFRSLSIDPTIGAIQIPINAYTLGRQFWRHLKRYSRYRGVPHFKIVLTNSMLANSNVHVIQTNKEIPDNGDPARLLDNIGYSVTSTGESAIDYAVQWRTTETYLNCNTSPEAPDLGYLVIVFPNNANLGASTLPVNLELVIYVDPSDIEMRVEISPTELGGYKDPVMGAMIRPKPVTFLPRPLEPLLEWESTTRLMDD
nr:MAG: polyprotein 2 [Picornavirales sp.]